MKPTLRNLKKRPALWAKHNSIRGGEIFPRITMPNGDADILKVKGEWLYDGVVSWHHWALDEWEFVAWL